MAGRACDSVGSKAEPWNQSLSTTSKNKNYKTLRYASIANSILNETR